MYLSILLSFIIPILVHGQTHIIDCGLSSGCTTAQTHTCPTGSDCIFIRNVTGGTPSGTLSGSKINAQNANSLQVFCDGGDSQCANMDYNCPIGGTCEIYATTGVRNILSSKIYAEDSSFLYIETKTLGALWKSAVYCPQSSIKGGANGACVVDIWYSDSGGPYAPLGLTGFTAKEAFKDLRLTCTIANGNNCGPITMRCGEDLQYNCGGGSLRVNHIGYDNNAWKVYDPDGWQCQGRWSKALVNMPCNNFTYTPTAHPTSDPTMEPTPRPSKSPLPNGETHGPTMDPTNDPTFDPTSDPTNDPSIDPTADPTTDPTNDPTADPTSDPTSDPTKDPTIDPTNDPTYDPTTEPTEEPTVMPTVEPTQEPTLIPTEDPTEVIVEEEFSTTDSEANSAVEYQIFAAMIVVNAVLFGFN